MRKTQTTLGFLAEGCNVEVWLVTGSYQSPQSLLGFASSLVSLHASTSDFAPNYAFYSFMGSSGFNSSVCCWFPSIFFFFSFFFLFGSKLFKESTLVFTVDVQVFFLIAVLELGTEGIGCCWEKGIQDWDLLEKLRRDIALSHLMGWSLLAVGSLTEEPFQTESLCISKIIKSAGRILGLVCSQDPSWGQDTYTPASFPLDALCSLCLTSLQVCSGLCLLAQALHAAHLSQAPLPTAKDAEF